MWDKIVKRWKRLWGREPATVAKRTGLSDKEGGSPTRRPEVAQVTGKGSMKLTYKQQRFAEEYLVDGNATQAAIRAGYSKRTARIIGCENLTKPNIKALIDAGRQVLTVRTEVNADNVIRELCLLGFANMGDYITIDTEGSVRFKPWEDLNEGQLAAVQEVTQTMVKHSGDNGREYFMTKFKLHGKEGALDKLARQLGLYKNDFSQRPVIPVIQVIPADARSTRVIPSPNPAIGQFSSL